MNNAIWTPKKIDKTRMHAFMRFAEKKQQKIFECYHDLHRWSVEHPEQFWACLCDYFNIQFKTPATSVLDNKKDMISARWFNGATFNFAEQLLSRDDEHPALISVDEQGNRRVISYRELKNQVSQCSHGLKKAGIVAGDRIAAIMPNVHYTVIAMLATTSLGAIWSSCSTDFGASAAIDRLGQIEPTILFACNGHVYQGKTHDELSKIQHVSTMIPSITHIVLCPVIKPDINSPPFEKCIWWDDFLEPITTQQFTPYPFSHPVYILFSSGTTGKPKCIIHSAGGTLLQHIKELGLHTDIHHTDNLFFYTTCGWMMWNWMVSSLALGATITLYEGSPTYPDINRLFKLISDENVTVFGTSPKFLTTIEQAHYKPQNEFSMQSLRCILSTGSPLLPEQYDFVYQHIKSDIQLSSISGGTDIISCFAIGNPILPVYRGELQCAGLGMRVEIYDDSGQSIKCARGELVCTQAFPSMPIGFWNDEDRKNYQNAYFSRFDNVWAQGDFAQITENEGLIIYGRADAVLNPGGVRIGTAEIYREVEKISAV